MHDLSPAAQQYVRAIYELEQRQRLEEKPRDGVTRVTTSRLADWLGLRAASVTAMLQKLAEASPPLIEYTKHQGVVLTLEGQLVALALVRRHRLLELFLYEKLDYRWDEVHDEAVRLEPVVSSALAERLAEVLGQPERDPHGHAIPAPDLTLGTPLSVPLAMLETGDYGIVRHVADKDSEVLRSLAELGLRPGTHFRLLQASDGEQPAILSLAGVEAPAELAAWCVDAVFVRLLPEKPAPGEDTLDLD